MDDARLDCGRGALSELTGLRRSVRGMRALSARAQPCPSAPAWLLLLLEDVMDLD